MRNHLLRAGLLHALGALAAAPLAGCTTTATTEVLASAVPAVGPMAVGPGGIFFVGGSEFEGPQPLLRIPLDGGPTATLDPSTSVTALALDQDSVFYGNLSFQLPGPPVWSFTLDRVAQAGGAPQTLVSGDG